MSATSKKPRRKPADQALGRKLRSLTRRANKIQLKLLALPPRPEIRRVPLWEVVNSQRSLFMSLQGSLARSFAATYNESLPEHPAEVVERSALIAEGGGV